MGRSLRHCASARTRTSAQVVSIDGTARARYDQLRERDRDRLRRPLLLLFAPAAHAEVLLEESRVAHVETEGGKQGAAEAGHEADRTRNGKV